MKIGIDARLALHDPHGISRYIYHFLHILADYDKQNTYVLYIDKPDVEGILPLRFEKRVLKSKNPFVWEQVLLPRAVKRDGIDILHCIANTAPIILDKKILLFMTVHDVMYLDRSNDALAPGNWYQRLGKMYRTLIVPRAVRRADHIITVSQFSKKEICSKLRLDDSLIEVIYQGCEFVQGDADYSIEQIKEHYGITGQYMISFGGIAPRKNTKRSLEVFALLQNKYNLQLVVTGLPEPLRKPFVDLAIKLNIIDKVRFLGFVPEGQLSLLLRNSKLLLFLTKYEGFGLPVLEGMLNGVPTIASNVTSVPEIAGDGAYLVNPDDDQAVLSAISDLLTNAEMRNSFIQKGLLRSKEFTWEKNTLQVLDAYERVSARKYAQ